MDSEKKLNKDYEFFISQLDNLLSKKENKGKVVIIKDKKIISIHDSFDVALKVATQEKKFEAGTFLIQKIEKPKHHYISRLDFSKQT